MSDRRYGCGCYECCGICFDNSWGDPIKEAQRLNNGETRSREMTKKQLDDEIKRLTNLRDLM